MSEAGDSCTAECARKAEVYDRIAEIVAGVAGSDFRDASAIAAFPHIARLFPEAAS